MKANIRTINKALRAKYGDVELVRGDGYYYVVGGDTALFYSTSIYTPRLSDQSHEEWMSDIARMFATKGRGY